MQDYTSVNPDLLVLREEREANEWDDEETSGVPIKRLLASPERPPKKYTEFVCYLLPLRPARG